MVINYKQISSRMESGWLSPVDAGLTKDSLQLLLDHDLGPLYELLRSPSTGHSYCRLNITSSLYPVQDISCTGNGCESNVSTYGVQARPDKVSPV